MKKLCSILLAMALIVGFVIPVASAETYTVTLDFNGGQDNMGIGNVHELEGMEGAPARALLIKGDFHTYSK